METMKKEQRLPDAGKRCERGEQTAQRIIGQVKKYPL